MDNYALVGNAVPLFSVVHINVIDQLTDHAPCNRGILAAADELNGRPRRKLGYRTPEELFELFLDAVYAA